MKLGFAVEIVRGRHLTRLERYSARQGGSRQDRAASVRALTLPAAADAVENVHPPRRGSVKRFSRVPEIKRNQHAPARAAEESPNGPKSRRTEHHQQPRRAYRPWPEAHIEFARRLQIRMPALRRYHAATVCRLLAQSHVNPDRWTVDSLLHVLELSSNQRGGLYFQTERAMKNPLAYTAAVLKNSIDPTVETPKEKRLREHAERDAHRQQERRQHTDTPADSAPREAFFAMQGKSPRLRPGTTQSELVRQMIGSSKLYDLDITAQLAVAAVTDAHRRLTARGWCIEISSSGILAISPDQRRTLAVRLQNLHSPNPTLAYELTTVSGLLRGGNLSIDTNRVNGSFGTKSTNDNNNANTANRNNGDNHNNDTVSGVDAETTVYTENANRVVDTNRNNGRIFINGDNAVKSVNSSNVTNGNNDTV